jgi:O-antigen/teichoic acid export membrane protein
MKQTVNLIVQHLLWRGLYFFSVLILNVLISRLFAAEKSGQIFYIVNNLAFVLLLVSMSVESAAVYFVSSGKLDGLKMARFCVLWIVFATALAASGWWLSLRLTKSVFSGNTIFLCASLLFIAGALMTTFFSALFYARQKFGLPNKILFIVNGCLIILMISGNSSAWTRVYFLALYFSSYFLQGLALMIIFFIRYPGKKERGLPALPILLKVLRYASAAAAANIIYFLVNRIDYWFVKHYCSAQDLGNYIQASKLAQMLLIVPSILGATLFPMIASGKKKSTGVPLAPVVRVLFWINIGICTPLILVGYWAFPFVFGTSFSGMYPLFLLLVPGLLCLTANYPLTSWNSGKNRVKKNIKGSIIALIIIAAGDFFILPHYGARTAAVISSIGYLCYYCYVLFCYRQEQPSDLSDFFVLKKTDFLWMFFQINRLMGKYTGQGEFKLPKQGS